MTDTITINGFTYGADMATVLSAFICIAVMPRIILFSLQRKYLF